MGEFEQGSFLQSVERNLLVFQSLSSGEVLSEWETPLPGLGVMYMGPVIRRRQLRKKDILRRSKLRFGALAKFVEREGYYSSRWEILISS